jgi:hypothetical protein
MVKIRGAAVVEAINDAMMRSMLHAREQYGGVMPDTGVFDTVLEQWQARGWPG